MRELCWLTTLALGGRSDEVCRLDPAGATGQRPLLNPPFKSAHVEWKLIRVELVRSGSSARRGAAASRSFAGPMKRVGGSPVAFASVTKMMRNKGAGCVMRLLGEKRLRAGSALHHEKTPAEPTSGALSFSQAGAIHARPETNAGPPLEVPR